MLSRSHDFSHQTCCLVRSRLLSAVHWLDHTHTHTHGYSLHVCIHNWQNAVVWWNIVGNHLCCVESIQDIWRYLAVEESYGEIRFYYYLKSSRVKWVLLSGCWNQPSFSLFSFSIKCLEHQHHLLAMWEMYNPNTNELWLKVASNMM